MIAAQMLMFFPSAPLAQNPMLVVSASLTASTSPLYVLSKVSFRFSGFFLFLFESFIKRIFPSHVVSCRYLHFRRATNSKFFVVLVHDNFHWDWTYVSLTRNLVHYPNFSFTVFV